MSGGASRSKEALLAYTRKLELVLVAHLCKKQGEQAPGDLAALVLTEADLQSARGRLVWAVGYTPEGERCTVVRVEQPLVQVAAPAVPELPPTEG